MGDATFSEHLDAAAQAARLAGKELLEAWGGDIAVLHEDENDIKLAMDRRAEEVIVGHLSGRFPGHGFLAEEGGETAGEGVQWVVDPLDGTHNYFRRIPFWCVCIAAVADGEPVAGVVYDPVHGHLFAARKGGGAYLNGRPIRVGTKPSLSGAVVAYGIYHREEKSVAAWLRRTPYISPRARSTRNLGAGGLHTAYVAAGMVDAFAQYGVRPWDITAGIVLVREAGGVATCWPCGDGGLDVLFASPEVHEEMLRSGLWPLPDEDYRVREVAMT